MSRATQHFIWLQGDKITLCGKPNNGRAIRPFEWFPFHENDCAICRRAVGAHFHRQGRNDEFLIESAHLITGMKR